MKIDPKYKVRELVGEHVVVSQGTYGADMTRIISLNESANWLWEQLAGQDFTADTVAQLLVERYEIDAATAQRDAAAWIAKMAECKLLEE